MHCTACFPIQLPVLTGMLQIQKYKDNDSKDKCKKMKEEIKFPLLNSDIGLLPYRAADNHNQPKNFYVFKKRVISLLNVRSREY